MKTNINRIISILTVISLLFVSIVSVFTINANPVLQEETYVKLDNLLLETATKTGRNPYIWTDVKAPNLSLTQNFAMPSSEFATARVYKSGIEQQVNITTSSMYSANAVDGFRFMLAVIKDGATWATVLKPDIKVSGQSVSQGADGFYYFDKSIASASQATIDKTFVINLEKNSKLYFIIDKIYTNSSNTLKVNSIFGLTSVGDSKSTIANPDSNINGGDNWYYEALSLVYEKSIDQVNISSEDLEVSNNVWSKSLDSQVAIASDNVTPGTSSVARVFVAPTDGVVSLPDNKSYFKVNNKASIDGIKFMILHTQNGGTSTTVLKPNVYNTTSNGVVSPQLSDGSYYDRFDSTVLNSKHWFYLSDQIQVKAGDKLYFVVDKYSNSTNDATTLVVCPTFEGTEYNSQSQFSLIQGKDNWRYEKIDIIKNTIIDTKPNDLVSNSYMSITSEEMTLNNNQMQTLNRDDLAIIGIGSNPDKVHPGSENSSARVLNISKNGYLNVKDAYIKLQNPLTTNSDGVKLTILKIDFNKKDTVILKPTIAGLTIENDGSFIINNTTTYNFGFENLPVFDGDKIYFVVSKNYTNENDETALVINGISITTTYGVKTLKGSTESFLNLPVQGANDWYYYGVKMQKTSAPGEALTPENLVSDINTIVKSVDMVEKTTAYSFNPMWIPSDEYCLVGTNSQIQTIHPGNVYDAARVLIVPEDGKLSVGNGSIILEYAPTIGDTADGIRLQLLKKSGKTFTLLLPTVSDVNGNNLTADSDGYYSIITSTKFVFSFSNLPVLAGDKIYFCLNRNGNNSTDSSKMEIGNIVLKTQTDVLTMKNATDGFSTIQGKDNWGCEGVMVTVGGDPLDVLSPASLLTTRVPKYEQTPMELISNPPASPYWSYGSGTEYCLIGNASSPYNLHPGTTYGSTRILSVPIDGKLSIGKNSAYFAKDNNQGDGVRIMFLIKNSTGSFVLKPEVKFESSTEMYPPDSQGWYIIPTTKSGKKLYFSFNGLPVKAGDQVYFVLDKFSSNGFDSTSCSIDNISIIKDDKEVVYLEGSIGGFSAEQGKNNWSYMGVKIRNTVSADDYEAWNGIPIPQPSDNSSFRKIAVGDVGFLTWSSEISKYYTTSSGGSFCEINDERGTHPGENVGIARSFTAPEDGRVRILNDGNSYIKKDVNTGDGVRFRIMRNDVLIYPLNNDGWSVITNAEKNNIYLTNELAVNAGDTLAFIVEKNIDTKDDHINMEINLSFAVKGSPHLKYINYNSVSNFATINGKNDWSYMYYDFRQLGVSGIDSTKLNITGSEIVINSNKITVTGDMTIQDVLLFLYANLNFSFEFYNNSSERVLDYSLNISTVKTIKVIDLNGIIKVIEIIN